MKTARTQPTLQEFKAWAKTNRRLALAVCAAQAYAETKRAQVDAYIAPIFSRYDFRVSRDCQIAELDEKVASVKDLYLTDLDSLEVAAFYAECEQAHRSHGFDGPAGHCPALVAESLLIAAQNALLDAGKELTGLDATSLYGDNRKKMLDLLISACLNKNA